MQRIHDKDGREWRVPSLSVGLALDLKEQAGFDCLELKGKDKEEAGRSAGEMAAKLYDPFFLGSVLWVLLAPQCREAGIDERQFGYLFDDTTYPACRLAILTAVVNFTLPPKVATEMMAELRGRIEKAETALIAALKNSVSESEGQSESTPDRLA